MSARTPSNLPSLAPQEAAATLHELRAAVYHAAEPQPVIKVVPALSTSNLDKIDYQQIMCEKGETVAMLVTIGDPENGVDAYSMTVVHYNQGHHSHLTANLAVAAALGPNFSSWYGDVVVLGCGADGRRFHDLLDFKGVKDAVICVTRAVFDYMDEQR